MQANTFRRAASAEELAEQHWNPLVDTIPRLFNRDCNGRGFEQLYTHAFTLALNGHAKRLYDEVRALVKQYLQTEMRPIVLHLMRESLLDFEFFEILIRLWREYTVCMQMIAYVLLYLERMHKLPIYPIGLRLFREEVLEFPEIKAHLELIGVEVDFDSIDLNNINDESTQPFRYK